jgi:hypothetical protein
MTSPTYKDLWPGPLIQYPEGEAPLYSLMEQLTKNGWKLDPAGNRGQKWYEYRFRRRK